MVRTFYMYRILYIICIGMMNCQRAHHSFVLGLAGGDAIFMMDAPRHMGGNPLTFDNDSLPDWDLSDLYPGMESDELARDLETAQGLAEAFETRYAGKLNDLDGAGLGAAIAEYEAIDETLGRVIELVGL